MTAKSRLYGIPTGHAGDCEVGYIKLNIGFINPEIEFSSDLMPIFRKIHN